MSVAVTLHQPSQPSQRFVEQDVTYHSDTAGPDPELKKLFPLLFADLEEEETTPNQEEQEYFPPLFVDNSNGSTKKSASAQKVSPILVSEILGISTHFSRFHPGIDYRAKVGTPIHAILPGTVNEIGFERGGYGRYVILVHHVDGETLFSLYAHMKSTNVLEGDLVDAGKKIGEVGLTGRTTGPHLHFELHDSKRAMDPLKFFTSDTLAWVKN